MQLFTTWRHLIYIIYAKKLRLAPGHWGGGHQQWGTETPPVAAVGPPTPRWTAEYRVHEGGKVGEGGQEGGADDGHPAAPSTPKVVGKLGFPFGLASSEPGPPEAYGTSGGGEDGGPGELGEQGGVDEGVGVGVVGGGGRTVGGGGGLLGPQHALVLDAVNFHVNGQRLPAPVGMARTVSGVGVSLTW